MKSPLAVALVALVAPPAAAYAAGKVEHINPPTLSKPTGYTHVVAAHGGRTIYVSGQVPFDKTGKLVGAGDFSAQVRQAFENVKAALAAADANFGDVVKLTVFVTDASKLQDYRKVRDEYVGAEPPASTFVEVRALSKPEMMIEMEAIAVTH